MSEKSRHTMPAPLLHVLAVLLSASLLTHCTRVATQAPEDRTVGGTLSGLPDIPTTVSGWMAAGDPQNYTEEDLYLYINGGAVTWIECGFRQVAAREYVNSQENRMTLEIYEMVDKQAARCIYQQRTGEGGEVIQLGDGGKLYDYYLEFHRGRFLVTLTSLDTSTGPVPEMTDLAVAVDGLLKTSRFNHQ